MVAAKSYSIYSAFLTKHQFLSSKQASLCFLRAPNVAFLTKLQLKNDGNQVDN